MSTASLGDAAAGAGALQQGPALSAILGRLHRALRKRVRETMPGPALPHSQVEVLRLLDQSPGLRAREVSERLVLAPNTTSTVIQQLLQLGYIARQVDAQDRRSANLTLTESARNRIEYWRDSRGSVLAHAVDTLSSDDRDSILAALPALERLVALLEAPMP